jgi:hypothetical protein
MVLVTVIVLMGLELTCAPWMFRLGGRIRPLPVWAGSGVVPGPSGPYQIYVWLAPQPSATQLVPFTDVLGTGYLCTPLGERYSLRVSGGAAGMSWQDMDGQAFHLEAVHRAPFWSASQEPHLPSLRFSGRWMGTSLVMTDDASIEHAFLPDGRLNEQAQDAGHAASQAQPVTLDEFAWWSGPPECQRPSSPAAQAQQPAHSAAQMRQPPAR